MSDRHVVIIGGGVGGLAAAIRLAASRRFRVTLLEKNPRVGGKLNLWEVPHPHRPADRPFRFDTGPSLLTLPQFFEDLFRAAGRRLNDHLHLERLDPIARYAWADGATFEARAGREDLLRELDRLSPADVDGWNRFAARGKAIWDLSADLFLQHAPEQLMKPTPGDRFAGLRMLAVPFKIGMFQKFSRLVDRHVRHPKLREVLYQYATYSGASPFRAPATLSVIPHAEFEFGGWYVRGGMYEIARQLESLAREFGVEIRTDCEARQILVEAHVGAGAKEKRRGVVRGVELPNGSTLACDAVVANADVVHTYRRLVAPEFRRKYSDKTLDKLDPGGSGLILMLGVDGTYPHLAHHNKFMPRDYRSDLVAMFETHTVPDDPCIYVCATTRTDPTVAPDGCENLFVLASAPALDGRIDWTAQTRRYRDQLVHMLETRWGLTDLSRRIVVERALSPADLQSAYNANAGSIYGIGSNSLKTAFLRPPNRDKEIRGLYFTGGATHPGGGLPLVTLSGKIAAELVTEDFS
jgi:phytoene desaturase